MTRMFSFEIITLIIIAIICATVAWVVSLQGWKVVVNRYFIGTALCVVPWALGVALFFGAQDENMARVGLLLFYIAPMFMILFLSMFATIFPAVNGRALTVSNIILATITVTVAACIVFNQDLLTASIEMNHGQNNLLTVEPISYTLYFGYFGLLFFVTFTEFYLQYKRQTDYRKKQIAYIFVGMFLAVLFSSITNLYLPIAGVSEYIWLGPIWTLFAVLAVTIAIVRHRLFDIKLAAVRSIAYAGVLLSLSAIYYLFAYLLSVLIFKDQVTHAVSISPVNIMLALLLAFMFQPIKRFFDRLTDSIFFRNTYQSDDFFARFSNMLASMSDLRGLLERAAIDLASTMKASQGFFFVYEGDTRHVSAGTRHHSKLAAADVRVFDEYTRQHGDEIVIAQLLESTHPLYRIMISYKLALVLPLRRGDVAIGYLCLGEQQGSGYSSRDIKILETVSDELVVAIQNAISIQEVKQLNATLQQRIDAATHELRKSNEQLRHIDEVKDEFISMASHQLRTPLTSIKGYISMVLEGDMGKITPQQRTVLEESFNSSERMVRLISDFLNVSRLQTGKFVIEKNPVNLAEVVRQEVDSLQVIAKTHDLKLEYKLPDDIPVIPLDEGKVRQVIMNFIDNAIYYSRANTKITVRVEHDDKRLSFTVHDTGIGVPIEEQGKLFAKFFRASNARKQRPDGTGVGLFLAKKVVTAHGGSMIFSSVEGGGSIFGFSVPIITGKIKE